MADKLLFFRRRFFRGLVRVPFVCGLIGAKVKLRAVGEPPLAEPILYMLEANELAIALASRGHAGRHLVWLKRGGSSFPAQKQVHAIIASRYHLNV